MPPENPILRKLPGAAGKAPVLIKMYRKLRDFSKKDPLVTATYRKLFERHRLTLPEIPPEKLGPEAGNIILPARYPLFAGEDAPLNDMLFLLNLAKGRQARRILEVGTYRARTTLALHLNCPKATIISYDIQALDSEFRQAAQATTQVELRHASFIASAEALLREPRFDLIFVDGSHRYEHVIEDSGLALQLVAPGGIIVWHDYRYNGYFNSGLKVPEALETICRDVPIFAVAGTMCAVHLNEGKPA